MSFYDSIYGGNYVGGPAAGPTEQDLAVLADWAESMIVAGTNPDWIRAYDALKNGADLLLRRQARSSSTPPIEKTGKP